MSVTLVMASDATEVGLLELKCCRNSCCLCETRDLILVEKFPEGKHFLGKPIWPLAADCRQESLTKPLTDQRSLDVWSYKEGKEGSGGMGRRMRAGTRGQNTDKQSEEERQRTG